jgi:hypothetical protein
MTTIEVPRDVLEQVQDRLEIVGAKNESFKKIESSLVFLHENLDFFKVIIPTLNSRLSMVEHSVTIGLPAQISQQILPDRAEVISQVSAMTQSALREELKALQQTIDDFRRDATATWATKSDLEIAKLESAGTTTMPTPSKSKVPAPTAFSGKREDWKTFSSHLSLFFTANTTQYPSDTDKILFAISRLGDGSAFKFMEQYIPDFKKPAATRPMIISSYDTFVDTLSENFGIQNAHVVAEAQLRSLKQKGSAMDYTNKFLELASETSWNDAAKISQYRLGLKDAIQDVLALTDEPTDFSTFTSKAINIDKRQYARYVEKQTSQNSPRSNPSSTSSAYRTHQAPPVTTSARPTNTSTVVSTAPSAPSMAMDLSQARHLSAEEKKRRQDNGLCLYCGDNDHFAKKCPNKKTLASADVVQNSFVSDSVAFTLGKDEA